VVIRKEIEDKRSGESKELLRETFIKALSASIRREAKDLPGDLMLDDLVYFNHAPIASVDMERSFSICKNMLTNNRRALKFDNIRKY
jgi:hypothetical protein